MQQGKRRSPRKKGLRTFGRIILPAAALWAGGCVAPPSPGWHFFRWRPSPANVHVEPLASDVERIAVLPFRAPTDLIGVSVADLFVTELLRAGRYSLVERSRMTQVLGEAELALAGLSVTNAMEAGALLGAQGVVMGTVDEYGTVAEAGLVWPVVAVSARLIDSRSGRVLWSADVARRADKAITLPEHARAVVHELVAGLYAKWPVQPQTRAPGVAVDETGLPAPEGLEVSDWGLREVELRWKPPRAPWRCRIERAETPDGPFDVVAEKPARWGRHFDRSRRGRPLADGATYYYRVAFVDQAGRCGPFSPVVESMIAPPPDPPRRVSAEPAGSRTVRVGWLPSSAEGVVRYEVERAEESSSNAFERVGATRDTFWTDNRGLADEATYLYRIRSVNRAGAVGPASRPVRVVTAPPPAPVRDLEARGGIRFVTLRWTSSLDPDVTRYEIFRSESEQGPYAMVGTRAGRENVTWTDGHARGRSLADGRRYFYTVVPVARSGARGARCAPVSAETWPAPPPVEGFSARSGLARRVALSWIPVNDEKVVGYDIHRENGGRWSGVTFRVQGRERREWLDVGAARGPAAGGGVEYRYRIAAVNEGGVRGPWSPVQTARTKAPPTPPSALAVGPGADGGRVLRWTPPPEPVRAYRVWRIGRFRAVPWRVVRAAECRLPDEWPLGTAVSVSAVDEDGLESLRAPPVIIPAGR